MRILQSNHVLLDEGGIVDQVVQVLDLDVQLLYCVIGEDVPARLDDDDMAVLVEFFEADGIVELVVLILREVNSKQILALQRCSCRWIDAVLLEEGQDVRQFEQRALRDIAHRYRPGLEGQSAAVEGQSLEAHVGCTHSLASTGSVVAIHAALCGYQMCQYYSSELIFVLCTHHLIVSDVQAIAVAMPHLWPRLRCEDEEEDV